MLRYFYLCIIFTALQTGLAFAEPVSEAKKPLAAKYDSLAVNARNFDGPALDNYRQLKEFQYTEDYVDLSLWDRLWRWFWSWFDPADSTVFGKGIRYILITLGILALVFLIVKLAGLDPLAIIRRKSTVAPLPYTEFTENIHQIDMDAELDKAVKSGNYRLAVRLLYLKCLKQLNDAGLIHWEANKTNSQYSNELQDIEQRLAFNLLTHQFEYIWYGEFNIDANIFNRVNHLFDNFKVKR